MNTQATGLAGALTEWLHANHFRFEGYHGDYRAPWFRKGRIRVTIDDPESGTVSIYAFDPRYPGADVLAWQARFAGAPIEALAPTITTAWQWAAAQMLPQD